jgi:hypothetical protein
MRDGLPVEFFAHFRETRHNPFGRCITQLGKCSLDDWFVRQSFSVAARRAVPISMSLGSSEAVCREI